MVTSASSGCSSATDTVVVTVDNATPTANAGSDATIDCNTTSATYWIFSRIRFYLRLDPNYRTVFLHSSTTDSNTNSTTTYTLGITNSSTGCTASDTVVVTVDNASPTANAGSDATIDCNTTSATYWSLSRIRFCLRLDPNYRTVFLHSSTTDSNTNSTTTYSLVVTSASGCSASDTVVVTVDNATPTANAGSDATIDL